MRVRVRVRVRVAEWVVPESVRLTGATSTAPTRTTVIEAIKFAITGALPPGSKSGSSFVHDPKSIGHTTVKANIKLRFTSRAGQTMVVVRSMEVTQRKIKATFKQLDGVLRTFDPETGERVALSHKCGELDKQIPSLLGTYIQTYISYILSSHDGMMDVVLH